jgi:Flp pilus assembly pilin Flp
MRARGVVQAEYVIVLVLIAIAAIASLGALGGGVRCMFVASDGPAAIGCR